MKKLMLGAGHGSNGKGFSDPGAIGNGLHEADLTGEIVSLVVEELTPYSKELEVTVAPRGELYDRTEAANKTKVDFFLSVHINSGGGSGFESFSHTSAGVETLSLQEIIHNEVAEFFRSYNLPDRGMKQANFEVLRETKMPAVLIECGFIDSARDMQIVTGNMKELAKAITRGIVTALGLKRKESDLMFKDIDKCMYPDLAQKAVDSGLVAGVQRKGEVYLDPTESLTREQCWLMLLRLQASSKVSQNGVNLEDTLNQIEQEWTPSVVQIQAVNSVGSGSFVGPDLVLTNAHVVNGVDKVTVVTHDGIEMAGNVERRGIVFDDKENIIWTENGAAIDLALVRLTRKTTRKPIVFTDKDPDDTDFLLIFGSPLAIQNWKSLGIVSRQTSYYIDTDGAINPGNSGGPVFGLEGTCEGISVQKYVDVSVDNMAAIIKASAIKLWLAGRQNEIKF